MKKAITYLKNEPVLIIAWILALASMFIVPPDSAYAGYIDTHTLALLFCLMGVMASLQGIGFFRRAGEILLQKTRTSRQLEAVLIFLCFISSMLITNDVALITFVPFALEALRMAKLEKRIIPVVVMQTIAANLGSMATPIGNPQNLYLYSHYYLSAGTFFSVSLPYVAFSAVLLAVFILLKKPQPVCPPTAETKIISTRTHLATLAVLFLICLCAVAHILNVWLVLGIVAICLLILDRRCLLHVDYALLATFAGFFVFIGNLGRVPAFSDFLRSILEGREVLVAIAASQALSNVPCALLLSGFTENALALVIGTNLGGLGTLIASMASLISFKRIGIEYPNLRGRYLGYFTVANIVFLAFLLGLWLLL
ncbi:MAG: citrate transporter [Clostridiales bacterium]|nr:citrate transporter [Clostridiales bacterium]